MIPFVIAAQLTKTGIPCLRSPGGSDSKDTACDAGDPGSIPGSGRSWEVGNGDPLQYSCLENSVDYSPEGCKESEMTEHTHTVN